MRERGGVSHKFETLRGRAGVALFRVAAALIIITGAAMNVNIAQAQTHDDLNNLFAEWRAFERPPAHDGAPDYRAATFDARYAEFQALRDRLMAYDISDWPVADQVDWHVVRAELNGFDFNYRILKPWARDPAYYKTLWTEQSDVPAHEGPTHHAVVELWTYDFPLDGAAEAKLAQELAVIPPLYAQAKENLTGNARELWITGIRDIRNQARDLEALRARVGDGASDDLKAAIDAAIGATEDLTQWLEEEGETKDGPSGLGRENYTWYQQNVHLVPFTWEDEERLLKRELARAWASLKLEEQRNKDLPELTAARNEAEYQAKADKAVTQIIDFLKEKEIITVADYFEPQMRAHVGHYDPVETRNFFAIGAHLDPRPLFSHFYHWFELGRMVHEPNPRPVRRGPLLYNIFDSRNEGTATAVEEMFMHAGLEDDSPRAREIVWIMLAQRAARGLGSLYAQANEMTMEEAGGVHMNWTPRGWMKTEPNLVIFEQHLYMRQPGYGTSYVTGKYLLERALEDFAKEAEASGQPFVMRDFFDRLSQIGNIPTSLVRWEMTGRDDDIKKIFRYRRTESFN